MEEEKSAAVCCGLHIAKTWQNTHINLNLPETEGFPRYLGRKFRLDIWLTIPSKDYYRQNYLLMYSRRYSAYLEQCLQIEVLGLNI